MRGLEVRIPFFSHRWILPLVLVAVLALGFFSSAGAAPNNPVYTSTFGDSITGDNEFLGTDGKRRWTVDPGADDYQNESYERPTIQTYQTVDSKFSTEEYFQNIDIVQGRVGYDAQYLYIAIELFGRHKSDQGGDTLEGLKYEYGFRFSQDPDGRNGYLFRTEFADPLSSPTFDTLKNGAFRDTDGDIGGRGLINGAGSSGRSITKEDEPLEEVGMNGYNQQIIADGKISDGPGKDTPVLYSRIDPNNNKIVEMAFDYLAFGLTQDDIPDIQYFEMQAIKGDPTDPQNYFWNDKYNKSEAGAPYFDPGGLGTDGLENIYELDTVMGYVPEPTTIALLTVGIVGMTIRQRRK